MIPAQRCSRNVSRNARVQAQMHNAVFKSECDVCTWTAHAMSPWLNVGGDHSNE